MIENKINKYVEISMKVCREIIRLATEMLSTK